MGSSSLAAAGQAAQNAPPTPVGGPVLPCMAQRWIEIALTGQADDPIGGAAYRVVAAAGAVHAGTLDEAGLVRVMPIAQGDALVSFPEIVPDHGDPPSAPGKSLGDHEWAYLPGQPPQPCASGARHVFRIQDWGLEALDAVDHHEAMPAHDDAPPEDWDLEAMKLVEASEQ